MLAYVRGDIVVATHSDHQNIDPNLYGDDVFVVPLPDGTVLTRTGEPPPNGEPDLREQRIPHPNKPSLKSYAANKRWQLENNAGVTVGGVEYRSDIETRSRLGLAYSATQINTALMVDWKMKDGTFVDLTSDQIKIAIGEIHEFVEAAFTKEKTAVAAIDAGTATAYADIDAIFAAP